MYVMYEFMQGWAKAGCGFSSWLFTVPSINSWPRTKELLAYPLATVVVVDAVPVAVIVVALFEGVSGDADGAEEVQLAEHFERVMLNDEVNEKLGFARVDQGPRREGWLINMHTVSRLYII
jgi:hypothetical protein